MATDENDVKQKEIDGGSIGHDVFSHRLNLDPRYSDYLALSGFLATNGDKETTITDIEAAPLENLLGAQSKENEGRKTLVLDIDETLIHSEVFTTVKADLISDVIGYDLKITKIAGCVIYVYFRPGVKEFIEAVGKDYEVITFTAGGQTYADAIVDALDPNGVISHRLYSQHTTLRKQSPYYFYFKDLRILGRDLKDVILIDDLAHSYTTVKDLSTFDNLFFPWIEEHNAIPINSWALDSRHKEIAMDKNDKEFSQVLPVLQTTLKNINDVRDILDANKGFEWICNQKGD